jgi:predicted dehydrogenase
VEATPVAVVGCGHLGTFHARVYARNPACRLVAVVDIQEERARRLAAELGCEAATSFDALKGRVNASSVATPTTTHEKVSIGLLDAGIDVLVEKPLAPDIESGAAIVAAARRAGRILAVGQIERCNPGFLLACRELLAPRFIESHRLATFVPRSLDVDVILDLMIHDIDLVLAVAGSPLEQIDAIGVPVVTAEADIANARLRFADGSVANLTASRVSRQKMRKIRFFERNLYLSVDLQARRVESVRLVRSSAAAQGAALPADLPPEAAILAARGLALEQKTIEAAEGDALQTQIAAFLDACSGKGPPVVDGEAGLASLKVALEVRAAVANSIARLRGTVPA